MELTDAVFDEELAGGDGALTWEYTECPCGGAFQITHQALLDQKQGKITEHQADCPSCSRYALVRCTERELAMELELEFVPPPGTHEIRDGVIWRIPGADGSLN